MLRPLSIAAALAATAAPVSAEVPEVVTDLPVVQSLTAAVMGELGAATLLLDRGADAHDFQLRPSQIRALNGADLVIWIGPEMTPWLGRALGDDGARQLTLLQTPGTDLRTLDGGAGTDPHAWLDPDNAALWIGEIADRLAALDPGSATVYRANATLALRRIEMADRKVAERLEPARGKGLIMAHAAYGYFADHYGLTVVGSLAAGDAADPGAAHLADLRAWAESGDVACAFPEYGHDPLGVDQLVAGTPARLGLALDPEGREAEPDAQLYINLLDALAGAIADCAAGA